METAVTIGLDIAKSVFQVHGVDESGVVVVRRRLPRSKVLSFFASLPRCLVGLEACATAHHWGRELTNLGHDVRLMPPSYVKAYLKRQKNDAADAEAICEAVTRPSMRFVPIKSPQQQSMMSVHRVRHTLMRQRVQLSNAIRGHLGEFGLAAPIGRNGLARLIGAVSPAVQKLVPDEVRTAVLMLATQLHLVSEQILELDRKIKASALATDVGKRLMEVPGVGPLLPVHWSRRSLIRRGSSRGAISRPGSGLVPRQNSSGGKERLGGITKRGDRYLRQMLFVGALAVIRYAQRHGTKRPWIVQLLARRTTKIAAVALANKMARMIWAIMTTGERYREPIVAAAAAA